MALKDIVIENKVVKVGKASFSVTGLSLAGIVSMMGEYQQELADLFEGKRDIATVVQESPKFIAALIATAANEPDSVDVVMKLPIGVQLSAATAIWEMSSIDPDEVGNLLGSVLALIQKFNSKTPDLIQDLSGGSES